MAKMGRPVKEGESVTFKLTVPKPLHDQLLALAKGTYAGASVGEVASYLLKLQMSALVPLKMPKSPNGD